jgi:hypothetical protein
MRQVRREAVSELPACACPASPGGNGRVPALPGIAGPRLARENLTEQNAAEETSLLDFADCGATVQRVVALRFDGLEDGKAAATEHLEIYAEFALDLLRERKSQEEQFAGTSDQVLHQRDVALAEAATDDVVFADAVMSGCVERDVNAAFLQVAGNVLPEIRKLQRGAGGVGKLLAISSRYPQR